MPTHSVFKRFKRLFSRSTRLVEPTASTLPADACQNTGEAATTSDPPTVVMNVAQVTTSCLVDQATEAQETARRLGATASKAIERAPGAWSAAESTARLLEDVSSGLKVFARVLEGFGELHPYVQVVTSIINVVIVKPIVTQDARDEAFEALLKDMIRTYELVKKELHEDGAYAKNCAQYQTKLLIKISQETEKCALFIRDEYLAQGFWARATKNFVRGGEVDERLQQFKANFSDLRENWRDEKLMYLEASAALDKLSRVRNAGHTTDKSCLPNTRVDLLRKISDWVDDPDGSRALYLVGVAGSGKSSVAHTIAAQIDDKGRLGSFFAFDRSETDRVASRALGTIAYGLAHLDEDFRNALVRALRADPALADTTDIKKQWKELILRPSQSFSFDAPLLIVVDAFDECPGPRDDRARRELLNVLTTDVLALPRCLRVLLTSLAEADIVESMVFENCLDMADFMSSDDVHVYIRHRLPRPEKGGLNDSECSRLAAAADGLFQWAATACGFLEQRSRGTTMSQKFADHRDQLTKGNIQLDNGRPSLNALYSTVLHSTFDSKDVAVMTNFRAVMALMLSAHSPLSIAALQSIYSRAKESAYTLVEGILGGMGVVLQGTSSPTSPVRPMHTSFRDFLTSVSNDPWHIPTIDIHKAHSTLALGTIRVLAQNLTFNMLQLESSCINNEDIPDLALRLSRIPGEVFYSALNFHHHISFCISDLPTGYTISLEKLRIAARDVLSTKFLFWLELLCISRRTADQALDTLDDLFADRATRELISDARSFCEDFDGIFGDSVPHIYISALPFLPPDSHIRRLYQPRFSGLPTIHPPVPARPPGVKYHLRSSEDGTAGPMCIACVSNTVLIVGTGEGIMRIDVDDSPNRIAAPRHRECTCSVAYSPKHHLVVSGHVDGTLCLRDPTTLDAHIRLNAHVDSVTAVCFTPSESHLISCSRKALRLWAIDYDDHLLPMLELEGGNCITCSPNSRFVFCGRCDGTVAVFELPSGRLVGDPFVCRDEVKCLLHLPNSSRLAVGLGDGRLQVWDTDTRAMICQQRIGGCSSLTCIAFSPSVLAIVSCLDYEIILWDSENLHPIGVVRTVGIAGVLSSPDGHSLYLWSKKFRRTSMILSFRTASLVGTTPPSPLGAIRSISYSTDGRLIRADFSYSLSKCWDSQSGTPMPLPSDMTWRRPSTSTADGQLKVIFRNRQVLLRENTNGTPVCVVLKGSPATEFAGDISPDRLRLVTVSGDIARLWDLTRRTQIGERFLVPTRSDPISVSFSPDGREIAIGVQGRYKPKIKIGIVRIDQQPDHRQDAVPNFRCLNFTPQPTVDPDTGMDYADASLRCTSPDIRVPWNYRQPDDWPQKNLRLIIDPEFWAVDFANAHFGTEWAKCFKG